MERIRAFDCAYFALRIRCRHMKAMHALLLAALPLLSSAGSAVAQSAHYPSGVEGLKGATLPPPGLYFRDYNYFYTVDRFPGGPAGFGLDVYVQAPRLIGITDQKFLGGYYGWDVLFTFPYQDVEIGQASWSEFGFGDMFVEPVTLSWHEEKFDASVGYGVWAPTGGFDAMNPASPGKGFWTHMLTAGATWYFDADKTWALSALNRYEFNTEQQQTGITPGDVWTIEYGLSKTFCKTIKRALDD